MDTLTKAEFLGLLIGAFQALGTGIAVVALFLTVRQLRDSTRWNRLNAALAYLDPLRTAQAEKLAFDAVAPYGRDFHDPTANLTTVDAEAIVSNLTQYLEVKHFLNLLESSAAAIKIGALDDEFAYSQMGYYYPRCRDYFREVMKCARDRKHNEECWLEIDQLSDRWLERKEKEKHGGYIAKRYG